MHPERSIAMMAFHLSTGKILDRIDMLNAGIVDQDIHAAESASDPIDHVLDFIGIGNVGAGINTLTLC